MGQRVCICIQNVHTQIQFSKMAVTIYMPSSSVQEFQLLYILHMFVCFYPFIFPQILSLSTSVKIMPDFDYIGHTDQYAEKWHLYNTVFYFYCILLHLLRSSLISANKVLKLPYWTLNLKKSTSYVSISPNPYDLAKNRAHLQ